MAEPAHPRLLILDLVPHPAEQLGVLLAEPAGDAVAGGSGHS